MKSLSTAGLILCVSLLSVPGSALAATSGSTVQSAQGDPDTITDARPHTRESDISVLFWLPFEYYSIGFGGMVRYEIPILPDGFIPNINDEFTLEPSFGVAYSSVGGLGSNVGVVELAPAIYGIWRFHFSKEFDAYGGLGLGLNFGVYSESYLGTGVGVNFYFDPCVGINYRFPSSSIAFRGEIGPEGLKAGFSFYF